MAEKVRSAAHQEYNKAEVLSDVADRIKDGKDIFGRNASFVQVEIDETFPEYLRENQEEYSFLILKEEPPVKKGLRHMLGGIRRVYFQDRPFGETCFAENQGLKKYGTGGRTMDIPKVSICIPAYNNAAEVKRLLESIRMQTFRDMEIILTDDSTNEEIAELIKSSGWEDIRYIHNENLWATFSTGIKACQKRRENI